LLYHFSDLPNEESIEPSYDAIRDVILGFGFQLEVTIFAFDVQIGFLECSRICSFQKEKIQVKTRYAQNVNSMLQCEYNSVYFVCRRPHEHTDRINHTHNSESNGAQEQEN